MSPKHYPDVTKIVVVHLRCGKKKEPLQVIIESPKPKWAPAVALSLGGDSIRTFLNTHGVRAHRHRYRHRCMHRHPKDLEVRKKGKPSIYLVNFLCLKNLLFMIQSPMYQMMVNYIETNSAWLVVM